MRKLLTLMTLFFFPTAAFALPLGNPANASLLYNGVFTGMADSGCCCFFDCVKLNLGYYGDYVYDRSLRVDPDDVPANNVSPVTDDVFQTTIRTHAGYFALTFWNRVEVFATAGVSRIDVIALQSVWSQQARNFTELPSDTGFSWSVGARGTIWECGGFFLGVEGQYLRTRPHLISYRIITIPAQYLDFHYNYREWQVGLGLSYLIQVASCLSGIVPYGGVKWSSALLTTGNAQNLERSNTFFDLENRVRVGFAVGLTFVGSAAWSVTGEARFIDERAFSLMTEFVF